MRLSALPTTIRYARDGQLQPTGGSHNSIRARLRAALVYTYIESGGRGGSNSLERRCLRTVSYANSTVSDKVVGRTEIHTTQMLYWFYSDELHFRRPTRTFPEAQLTTPYEPRSLIQSLNTKSAPGTEGISATMLRNLSRKALIQLTQLWNHILRFRYFPYARKSAKVIPIQKADKPLSDPGSHSRPISLLSTVRKLLERVVAHGLNSIFHQNHIPPPEKFGFRKQHSTASQLARIADFITHGFNLRKYTGLVLLDTVNVYDTVWLNGLLFKLISLHLPDYLLFFFKRYFEGRTFTVHLNDSTSTPKSIPSGLPQGAVLSTTLFSL